jgi:hypothetical protein
MQIRPDKPPVTPQKAPGKSLAVLAVLLRKELLKAGVTPVVPRQAQQAKSHDTVLVLPDAVGDGLSLLRRLR